MCGIVGILGPGASTEKLSAMLASQHHRGPDFTSVFQDEAGRCFLGHNRLSIIDTSARSNQPMTDPSGRFTLVFNGEIYNYKELKRELNGKYEFVTEGDTELLLAAYINWKEKCLDKFIGMFSFAIWDKETKSLFIARDRFGVKPLNYTILEGNTFVFASEIKALFAAGASELPNDAAWAGYLAHARYDHNNDTFYKDIHKLPGGHYMYLQNGDIVIKQWYHLAEKSGIEYDQRPLKEIEEEYLSLVQDSISLRFRADVPIGINLSGGLDSSALLHFVDAFHGHQSQVNAYTFYTGDDRYDEIEWVKQMLKTTQHELNPCLLSSAEIPTLAEEIQSYQDEPYGGIPTIAYAQLFKKARKDGTIVLLDGQGMDEQWAGYDYYRKAETDLKTQAVQGVGKSSSTQASALNEDFASLADSEMPEFPFPDKLRNLQFRDVFITKIPRALRFNDRVSMRASVELREPFLDHRMFELAFRQRPEYKINGDTGKFFLRQLLAKRLPESIAEAPKRPLQTPQREWLREDLRDWVEGHIDNAIRIAGGRWLNTNIIKEKSNDFFAGKSDNSFYIWQWITISMMLGK